MQWKNHVAQEQEKAICFLKAKKVPETVTITDYELVVSDNCRYRVFAGNWCILFDKKKIVANYIKACSWIFEYLNSYKANLQLINIVLLKIPGVHII